MLESHPSLADAWASVEVVTRRALGRLVTGRLWALKVSLAATFLSFFVQPPALELHHDFFDRVKLQSHNVLRPLPTSIASPGSHESKLAFRLVPPLLLRVMHFGPAAYYVFQVTIGIATIAALAVIFHRFGLSRETSSVLVLAITSTYLGSVWFADTHPYFDAIAATALVVALALENPVACLVATSVAMWTDERAIAPVALIALWHGWNGRRSVRLSLVAAMLIYLAVRAVLTSHYGLHTDHGEVGLGVFRAYADTMPLALVVSLEGLSLLLAAGVTQAWLERRAQGAALLALTFVSAATAVMVDDVTRSCVYLLPAVVISVWFLSRARRSFLRPMIVLVAAVCVAIPTTVIIDRSFSSLIPLPVRLVL